MPAAVSAIGDEALRRINARSIQDIAGFVPGVKVSSNGVASGRVIIRGVDLGFFSPLMGILIEGVPAGPSNALAFGGTFTFDFDPASVAKA